MTKKSIIEQVMELDTEDSKKISKLDDIIKRLKKDIGKYKDPKLKQQGVTLIESAERKINNVKKEIEERNKINKKLLQDLRAMNKVYLPNIRKKAKKKGTKLQTALNESIKACNDSSPKSSAKKIKSILKKIDNQIKIMQNSITEFSQLAIEVHHELPHQGEYAEVSARNQQAKTQNIIQGMKEIDKIHKQIMKLGEKEEIVDLEVKDIIEKTQQSYILIANELPKIDNEMGQIIKEIDKFITETDEVTKQSKIETIVGICNEHIIKMKSLSKALKQGATLSENKGYEDLSDGYKAEVKSLEKISVNLINIFKATIQADYNEIMVSKSTDTSARGSQFQTIKNKMEKTIKPALDYELQNLGKLKAIQRMKSK